MNNTENHLDQIATLSVRIALIESRLKELAATSGRVTATEINDHNSELHLRRLLRALNTEREILRKERHEQSQK